MAYGGMPGTLSWRDEKKGCFEAFGCGVEDAGSPTLGDWKDYLWLHTFTI
jgi:hypothetical protein